jgi:GNAT superfamily N-acetyltransferase
VSDDVIVLRADDPQCTRLEAYGWVVVARSWGAELDAATVDRVKLSNLIDDARALGVVREMGVEDVDAILDLDAATAGDYPGNIATRHERLDRGRATPSDRRPAWGVHTPEGALAAMTFADLSGNGAEIDFTVVAPQWRGKGIGTALKASAVLALLDRGVQHIRTGGSADNAPIIAVNTNLGFVIDEQWITLQQPAR